MDPLHSIAVTLFLFVLTFFNPGANLFIVVQTTLSSGQKAGLTCGYGVVLGNAIYSGLGLFGLVTLMHEFGAFFSLIKVAGGAYLLWYAVTVFRNRTQLNLNTDSTLPAQHALRYFRRGLISDLSNPQTILFFISIFSVTLTPQTNAVVGKNHPVVRYYHGITYLADYSLPHIFPDLRTPHLFPHSSCGR